MTKQEFIHLHQLFAEVAVFCADDPDVSIDLDDYQAHNVRPVSVNHSKTAHKEAVMKLCRNLAKSLDSKGDADETKQIPSVAN